MMRFLFFVLLIASAGFAGVIYFDESRPAAEAVRETNPGTLKIISAIESTKAQQEALANKRVVESLGNSGCVEFGVKPADAARAQTAFADMQLGARLSSRNIEEFARYGVVIPAQSDKKAADNLLANLKKAGVKDVSLLPDNTISLGVFSSEEAAKRYFAELDGKTGALLKNAAIVPRNPQIRETVFNIKEPDINMIARLTVMQRDFESSSLKAVGCTAAAGPAALVAPTATPGKS